MEAERNTRKMVSSLAMVGAVYGAQFFNPLIVIVVASILESVIIGFVLGILKAIQESK
jgi:hypothetical protein